MSELKTLKEIGTESKYHKYYKESELKAEAIKWVKELEKINEKRRQEFCITCHKERNLDEAFTCWKQKHFLATTDWEESSDFSSMVGIIKHFFNLTEEDLK
jgi:hypothetical protein